MAASGMIVAIVASALFGTAILGIITYYLHRYVHQKCYQLDSWFHWPVKREDFLNEKESGLPPVSRRERSQQDSRSDHSNSRSRHSRSRKRRSSPKDAFRRRQPDTSRECQGESSQENFPNNTSHRQKERVREGLGQSLDRIIVPTYVPVQFPVPVYYPQAVATGWPAQIAAPRPPVAHPVNPTAIPMDNSMNIPMAQPRASSIPRSPMKAGLTSPASYEPGYNQQYVPPSEHGFAHNSINGGARREARSPWSEIRQVDFIAEVDALPEQLQKDLDELQIVAEVSSDNDDDGDVDEDIQQIPRTYIPRSVPQPAYWVTQPLQQPIVWAPQPERQSSRTMYAPYMKVMGQKRRLRNTERGSQALSNAPPKPDPM